jgi:2-(1,2-epoxy-1,2-dihydrophenyl)acetyl-CoA isomerase
MMMLGEKLPAETAESWGLIHRAVADDELMDQALQLATRLAAGPTRSYGIIRRNMRISLDGDWTQTLQAERIGQRDAGHSADFREGVAAFTERRKPVFQGR